MGESPFAIFFVLLPLKLDHYGNLFAIYIVIPLFIIEFLMVILIFLMITEFIRSFKKKQIILNTENHSYLWETINRNYQNSLFYSEQNNVIY